MLPIDGSVVLGVTVSVALVASLVAALVLVLLARRSADTALLASAGAFVVTPLLVLASVEVAVAPVVGVVLALLGAATAVVGGDPLVRRILAAASPDDVREGAGGGILVEPQPRAAASAGPARVEAVEVLRGGTTIGYLERLGVVLAIIAGYPAAIAVIVAVKSVGRFSELATSAARERFIIGTLASLVWACTVGGLVALAMR
ncbi:hypothetical protein GB864_10270 [Agromyces sp. MMS17-SY077]|uniref:Uncharacterized protein n=1 Tax=Agromyces seonyuensis TaxID=2662446 RepID=A0A6I4NX96_9MICO|nr:hypothetical protein [Agromyces seonyuensis]